jgi:hypothetical protein
LKAFPAEYRSTLGRPEGNGCFFAALRAGRFRFRSYLTATSRAGFGSLSLTSLAPLGLVLKTFVGEEHLFAGSKYKLGATLGTLQNLIVEFHGRLPLGPPSGQWGSGRLSPLAWTDSETRAPGVPGTGPSGRRAKNLNEFPTSLPDWGLIPEVRRRAASRAVLILLATLLLAQSLPRKRFFCPALLAGFHVEAVLLYFLNYVFLLHFALKASQCILKRLTLLNDYLCQLNFTSIPVRIGCM